MEIGQPTMVRLEICVLKKKNSKRSNKKKASLFCVEPIKNIMAARQNQICICPQKITVIQIHIVQSFIFYHLNKCDDKEMEMYFPQYRTMGFFRSSLEQNWNIYVHIKMYHSWK
jgi:hypothetical protein